MIKDPHDRFCYEVLTDKENAIDLIKNSSSDDLVRNLDLSTLKLDTTSYIDEELKKYFSDIVYGCVYKGKIQIKITLLIEHKSYSVKYPRFQLLRYMLNVWQTLEKQKEDPNVVVPLVVYHGEGKWNVKELWEYFDGIDETLKRYVPDFKYEILDLSKHTDEEVKEIYDRVNLTSSLLLLKNIFDEKKIEENIVDYLRISILHIDEEKELKFLKSVITYILYTVNIDIDSLAKKIENLTPEGGKEVMSTAARLLELGEIKGIEKGIEKGKRGVLIRQLTKKYSLSEEEKDLIKSVQDETKIDNAIDEILSAMSKEEIFKILK